MDRHEQENLSKLAEELKTKIRILEVNHKKNELDVENSKERIRRDFAQISDRRNAELMQELDAARDAFNAVRFQYSILKSEFDALRRSSAEHEEHWRTVVTTKEIEFDNERSLLLARIEQVLNEYSASRLEANEERQKVLASKELEAIKKLYSDLKKTTEERNELQVKLKLDRNQHEKEIDEMKKGLNRLEMSLSEARSDLTATNAENVELRKKCEYAEKDRVENEKIVYVLRVENERLKEKIVSDVDELTSRFRIEIIRLESQRDEAVNHNEELTEKMKDLDADLSTKTRSIEELELRLEESKLDGKHVDMQLTAKFSDERKQFETKLRQLEKERYKISAKHEQASYACEIKLKKSEWEKEKIAEELADIKMRLAQNELEKATASTEEKGKNATEQDEERMKLMEEIQRVKKELKEKDRTLLRLEQKMEMHREKRNQFHDLLKLFEEKIDNQKRSNVVESDGGSEVVRMINEIKQELKTLKDERRSHSVEQRIKEGQLQ